MNYDQNDEDLLSLCLYREARGEGEIGCRAVAHVILNRVGCAGFAAHIHEVIMGKNQFSSMSVPSDPEFHLIPEPGDEAFLMCREVSKNVLGGEDFDLTLSAHFYYNPNVATSTWFTENISGRDGNGMPRHKLTCKIGRHCFYV